QTKISLERIGQTPMPIDLTVTYEDGKKEIFNLPLDLMRGAKPSEFGEVKYTVLPDWRWTHPTYEITLDEKFKSISQVEIDASQRMADVDRENNSWKSDGENEGEATDEKD
ncbi:MAG: M1 family peptidase, partial [Bacteroidota bacterium]